MSSIRWLPLESNPDVMTKFLVEMGMSSEYGIVDVLGFDEELLGMLPQPVLSVILLYDVKKADPENGLGNVVESVSGDKVFFTKQSIGNACGTIALLHAVGNNLDNVKLIEGSLLDKFFNEIGGLSPSEIGKKLEGHDELAQSHESSAQEGQTAAPDINVDVYYHFIAFVERQGRLYELDGRKPGPVDHGVSSRDSFANDAAEVCKQFMNRNPGCLDFTAVALVKLSGEE